MKWFRYQLLSDNGTFVRHCLKPLRLKGGSDFEWRLGSNVCSFVWTRCKDGHVESGVHTSTYTPRHLKLPVMSPLCNVPTLFQGFPRVADSKPLYWSTLTKGNSSRHVFTMSNTLRRQNLLGDVFRGRRVLFGPTGVSTRCIRLTWNFVRSKVFRGSPRSNRLNYIVTSGDTKLRYSFHWLYWSGEKRGTKTKEVGKTRILRLE